MGHVQSGIEGLLDKARLARTRAKSDGQVERLDAKISGLKEAWMLVRVIRHGGDPSKLITQED
jgi:hypothetical protein